MSVQVDPLAPEPIFRQIADQVKAQVARGELVPGDRLPSIREQARAAGVNPHTVAKAYEELERGGVIARRRGAGCFVRGAGSPLGEAERARQLEALARRMVTEAWHLGVRADEVRAAVRAALSEVRRPARRPSRPAGGRS